MRMEPTAGSPGGICLLHHPLTLLVLLEFIDGARKIVAGVLQHVDHNRVEVVS